MIENGRGVGAEQRLVQIGIERRELLVGRLLRQIGVRPEAFERPVLRSCDQASLQNCRIAGLAETRIGRTNSSDDAEPFRAIRILRILQI